MEKNPLLLAGTEIYRPLCTELNQFRLLTILPGKAPAIVRCLMHTMSLDADAIPTYDTVSYVWGDPHERSSVIVNRSILNVPHSTMAVLRRMRRMDREHVVWIDAVCVNQNDAAERSAQVASMGKLYANGVSNLIFLGDDEEQVADDVLKVFDASYEHVSAAVKALSRQKQDDLKVGRPTYRFFHGNAIFQDMDVHQFELLYALPWFRRLWVVQEVALSRRNICHWGSTEFQLSQILLVSFVLDQTVTPWRLDSTATEGISAARQMYIQHSRTSDQHAASYLSYWPMLEESENFLASDSRDFCFATLQLYQAIIKRSKTPRLLVPDYSRPLGEVLRDTARYVLTDKDEEHNKDRLLRTITHRSVQDLEEKYTSWTIPIGRPREHRDGLLMDDYRCGWRKQDEFDLPLLLNSADDPDIIKLYVTKMGLASFITQETPYEYADEEGVAIARCVAAEVSSFTGYDDKATAAILTLGSLDGFRDETQRLAGHSLFRRHLEEQNRMPSDPTNSTKHLEPEFHLAWLFEDDFVYPTDLEADAHLASLFMYSSVRHAVNRRYFKTDTGYIGCGPKIMHETDILVVAQGGSTPYILRPVGSEYLFLGAAYAYGLMDGEVFDMCAQWEWVAIR